jgi:hypothetical protein
MDFNESLKEFVDTFVKSAQQKRAADETIRRCELEILCIQSEINALTPLLIRRPSTIRQINTLKHQIRERELTIASINWTPPSM